MYRAKKELVLGYMFIGLVSKLFIISVARFQFSVGLASQCLKEVGRSSSLCVRWRRSLGDDVEVLDKLSVIFAAVLDLLVRCSTYILQGMYASMMWRVRMRIEAMGSFFILLLGQDQVIASLST